MENHVIRLNKIIAEKFGVPEDEITPKSDLASDLNLSNLEITDLISEVSREFELHFREGTDIGATPVPCAKAASPVVRSA